MPLILLALVVSWALVRAWEETWGHAKVASAPARHKAAKRLDETVKARTKAKHWIPGREKGAWLPWAALTSAWLTGKTLKHGWGVSKAAGRGIRQGVQEGRRRYAEGMQARAEQAQAEGGHRKYAQWSWEEWADYLDRVSRHPTRGKAERLDGEPQAAPQQQSEPDIVDGVVTEDAAPADRQEQAAPALAPAADHPEPVTEVTAEVVTEQTPRQHIPLTPLPALESGTATTQGEIMTQTVSGEAANLAMARAAIASIEAMISDCAIAAENLMSGLASQGVGGSTLARFSTVMDSLFNARAIASDAAQGMEDDQSPVEEAIQAKADVVADNTAFYQGG